MSRTRIALLALLISSHLVVTGSLASRINWQIFPSLGDLLEFGIAFSLAISQIILVAFWATLSTTPFVVRLPMAFLLCVLQCGAVFFGRSFDPTYGPGDMIGEIWSELLPASFAICFLLFSVHRYFTRWRFTVSLKSKELPSRAHSQFSLGQLIFGVTLGCLAAGLVRSLAPVNVDSRLEQFMFTSIISALYTAVSLLVAIPCLVAAFHRRARPGVYFAACPLYGACVSLFEAMLIEAFSPGGMGDTTESLLLLFSYNLTLCLSVYGSGLYLRALAPEPAASPAAIE